MMKKIFAIAALMAVTMPMAAQETYENAKLAQGDLNGTARYVGMGGAMEALGADISTIGTNPAGIGLFRKSSVSMSFGLVSQDGVNSVLDASKTNASFDQLGFVYSSRTGKTSFLNLAFNYHKSRNFNQILSASHALDRAALNKLTYAKAKNELLFEERMGDNGKYVPNFDRPYLSCSQLDDMLSYWGMSYDEDDQMWYYYDADRYQFNRAQKGYIGEYDFNISGNINNRVYLGVTVGIHDVHYKHYGEYAEHIPDGANSFDVTVADTREITGTGFDVKAGIIFRPNESSPFRIGLSVATPTFYELYSNNYTYITDGPNSINTSHIHDASARTSYSFKLYTPWKFGLSMGHTIGTQVALGASYEYADYGSMDTRSITGEYYDYWSDSYITDSESDKAMNAHTERTLKGVHTLKLGAEYKPTKDVALRIGYNYVSPMYQTGGFKDGTIESPGTYVASAADFTNWEDTHRLTLGAGYTYNKFNVSLAYQYSTTSGKFYPFMSYEDNTTPDDSNIADGVKVNNNRHQLLLTLGYTF